MLQAAIATIEAKEEPVDSEKVEELQETEEKTNEEKIENAQEEIQENKLDE